jgi:hypothetical protein
MIYKLEVPAIHGDPVAARLLASVKRHVRLFQNIPGGLDTFRITGDADADRCVNTLLLHLI